MVFNTGSYTVLPDNSILITANMQSETGFPSGPSHQLKSYVASKSRLKLAARAVLSADAGLLVLTDIIGYDRQKLVKFIHQNETLGTPLEMHGERVLPFSPCRSLKRVIGF